MEQVDGEERRQQGWHTDRVVIWKEEKRQCALFFFFFFANLAYLQQKEFALLSDFRFMRSHIFSISVVLPDSEEPL